MELQFRLRINNGSRAVCGRVDQSRGRIKHFTPIAGHCLNAKPGALVSIPGTRNVLLLVVFADCKTSFTPLLEDITYR